MPCTWVTGMTIHICDHFKMLIIISVLPMKQKGHYQMQKQTQASCLTQFFVFHTHMFFSFPLKPCFRFVMSVKPLPADAFNKTLKCFALSRISITTHTNTQTKWTLTTPQKTQTKQTSDSDRWSTDPTPGKVIVAIQLTPHLYASMDAESKFGGCNVQQWSDCSHTTHTSSLDLHQSVDTNCVF